MIKNERQYRITKARVERFEDTLARLRRREASEDLNERLLQQLEEEALASQLDDLRREVSEYEDLKAGKRRVITASFGELPHVLIKARIALGLSQRELAERLGVKEQQIQRYEATDYASASLARVAEVIDALGLDVAEEVVLPGRAAVGS